MVDGTVDYQCTLRIRNEATATFKPQTQTGHNATAMSSPADTSDASDTSDIRLRLHRFVVADAKWAIGIISRFRGTGVSVKEWFAFVDGHTGGEVSVRREIDVAHEMEMVKPRIDTSYTWTRVMRGEGFAERCEEVTREAAQELIVFASGRVLRKEQYRLAPEVPGVEVVLTVYDADNGMPDGMVTIVDVACVDPVDVAKAVAAIPKGFRCIYDVTDVAHVRESSMAAQVSKNDRLSMGVLRPGDTLAIVDKTHMPLAQP